MNRLQGGGGGGKEERERSVLGSPESGGWKVA